MRSATTENLFFIVSAMFKQLSDIFFNMRFSSSFRPERRWESQSLPRVALHINRTVCLLPAGAAGREPLRCRREPLAAGHVHAPLLPPVVMINTRRADPVYADVLGLRLAWQRPFRPVSYLWRPRYSLSNEIFFENVPEHCFAGSCHLGTTMAFHLCSTLATNPHCLAF